MTRFLPIAALVLFFAAHPAAAQNVVPVPVPTVTLYPGEPISAEQLTERRFRISSRSMHAVALSKDDIIGKVARRTLAAGQIIPQNAIETMKVVKRGVPVRVIFEEAGLTIVTYAEPLQSAGIGEIVRMRNVDSGTVIVGTVQPDGSVMVGAS